MSSRRPGMLGAPLVLVVVLLLAGCTPSAGKPAAGASQPPVATRTGSFVATWVPPTIDPEVSKGKQAELSWRSPSGTSGQVPVTEAVAFSGRDRNGAAITLLAARAASYPAAFWSSYLRQPAWSHQQSGGRLILSQRSAQSRIDQAVFEQHGYFVEATAARVPLAELVQFCGRLRFEPA